MQTHHDTETVRDAIKELTDGELVESYYQSDVGTNWFYEHRLEMDIRNILWD